MKFRQEPAFYPGENAPVPIVSGPFTGLIRYNGDLYVTAEEEPVLRDHLTSRGLLAILPDGEQFKALASDDSVKQDLELTCTFCGEVLCDVQNGDGMNTLTHVANGHRCLLTPAGEVLTWAEIGAAWDQMPDLLSAAECCPHPCTCTGRGTVTSPHTDPACPWYGTDTLL
jgi:hypothetical protein